MHLRTSLMTLALLMVTAPAACHGGFRTRSAGADAGGGVGGGADVVPAGSNADAAPTGPDDSAPVGIPVDGGGSIDGAATGVGDSGSARGIPKGFRIVNATANTVYVDLNDPVKCRTQDASGWQACQFFGMYCLPGCQYIQPGDQCCVECEQKLPTLLAVPAGGDRTVAWTGSLSTVRTDYCSDCQCQEQSAVGQGTFEATVRAHDQYSCVWGQPCPEKPDGTIPYAAPQGSFEEHAVQFAIPSADEKVVITIPAELSVWQVVPGADALLGVPLTAVGKVFADVRQKPGSWPAPALSLYVLQDGGDTAAYTSDPPPPFIQLYSASDLSAYLQQQVRVTAYLRSVVVEYFGGESHPFFYLDVISITAI